MRKFYSLICILFLIPCFTNAQQSSSKITYSFQQKALVPLPSYITSIKGAFIKHCKGSDCQIGHASRDSKNRPIWVDDEKKILSDNIYIDGFDYNVKDYQLVVYIELGTVEKPLVAVQTGDRKDYGEGRFSISYKWWMTSKLIVKDVNNKTYLEQQLEDGSQKHSYSCDQTNSFYSDALMYTAAAKVACRKANNIINHNFGKSWIKRELVLYSMKSKKQDYSDVDRINSSFIEIVKGFDKEINEKQVESTLDVIKQWRNILVTADYSNKKERINALAAEGLYLNIIQAYYFINHCDEALKVIDEMNNTIPSLTHGGQKKAKDLEYWIKDQKKRIEANENYHE